MNTTMAVILDGVAQLEFDRQKPLPAHQALYLRKMDEKMDQGIDLHGEWVDSPASGERAQFVAANLAGALKQGNADMAAAMCSYLAVRQPDLLQVKIHTREEGMEIDLDYENPYRKQVSVSFTSH